MNQRTAFACGILSGSVAMSAYFSILTKPLTSYLDAPAQNVPSVISPDITPYQLTESDAEFSLYVRIGPIKEDTAIRLENSLDNQSCIGCHSLPETIKKMEEQKEFTSSYSTFIY